MNTSNPQNYNIGPKIGAGFTTEMNKADLNCTPTDFDIVRDASCSFDLADPQQPEPHQPRELSQIKKQFTFDCSTSHQNIKLQNSGASHEGFDEQEEQDSEISPIQRMPSSSRNFEMIDEAKAAESLATKYTDSQEKQREIISQWLTLYLILGWLRLPDAIRRLFVDQVSLGYFFEINRIGFLLINTSLYARKRTRLRYLVPIILSLNYLNLMMTIQVFLLTGHPEFETEVLTSEEIEAIKDLDHSNQLGLCLNLMPLILMNTTLSCLLISKRWLQVLVLFLSVVFVQVVIWTKIGPILAEENAIGPYLVFIVSWLFYMSFAKISTELDTEKFRFMLQQNHENEIFKRVIHAVDDAMIIIDSEGAVQFKNQSADEIFFATEPGTSRAALPQEALKQSNIFLFQKCSGSKGEDASELIQEISLHDLALKPKHRTRNQVYTRHREIGLCSSMAQTSMITKLNKSKAEDSLGFDFFLVKFIRLQESKAAGTEAVTVIQIVDISEKVFNDCLASEQRYLTFITATVSHEMRNPLNSLMAQIANQASLIRQLQQDYTRSKLLLELEESISISQKAADMLDFNVENIISLPKLKDKTFKKTFTIQSVAEAVEEVKAITSWTAEQRGIPVSVSLLGCDGNEISFDKKRLQQMLLNYLSNAIKFTDKEEGKVRILVQLIRCEEDAREAPFSFEREVLEFYGFNLVPEARRHLVGRSQSALADSIFAWAGSPKLIISVFDNGVGISEPQQEKLYNLFSNLQQTGEVQAKGIGLGVVVSSLISEEFGGISQLFSRPTHGSIFQSSLEVKIPTDDQQGTSKFAPCFQDGFPAPSLITKISSEDRAEFLQYFSDLELRFDDPAASESKRILIVDDEPYNCLALLTLLKSLSLKNATARVDLCLGGRDAILEVINAIHPRGAAPSRASSPSPNAFISPASANQNQFGKAHQEDANKLAQDLLDAVRAGSDLPEAAVRSILNPRAINECDYGLILTDCSMPFVDGYETSKAIRLLLSSSGITSLESQPRIVAVTGHCEEEFQLKAVVSGIEKVCPKPMTQEALRKVLVQCGFESQIRP